MDNIKVGETIKWNGYGGEKTGKVVALLTTDPSVDNGRSRLVGYYVAEERSTQGFPSNYQPVLVSPFDVIGTV